MNDRNVKQCVISSNKSEWFRSSDQDIGERIERLQANPNVTEHMLAEWKLAVCVANLLVCMPRRRTKRVQFFTEDLAKLLVRIANDESSFLILKLFRQTIAKYTTATAALMRFFRAVYAAVHIKAKTAKANKAMAAATATAKSRDGIDFGSLPGDACCMFCQTTTDVTECAGHNCVRRFHPTCLSLHKQSGMYARRSAQRTESGTSLMCQKCEQSGLHHKLFAAFVCHVRTKK